MRRYCKGVRMEFCIKCFGAGHFQIRPDQIGYLRRPEHEREGKDVRVYEHPDGALEAMMRPWKLLIRCPLCQPEFYRQRRRKSA